MRPFGLCDSAVEGNQAHLDCNLPRRRVGVWHHDEQTPAGSKPVVDASQDGDWIVKVLERVNEEDRVVAVGDVDGLKRTVQEAGAASQARACGAHELLRALNDRKVG